MAERDPVLEDDQLLDRLTAVAAKVRALVPDRIGMSVSMIADDLVVTLVATDADIAVLDAMQYLSDGPCLAGIRAEKVLEFNEEELLDEEDWRIFALASASSAVRSTLTLPIMAGGRITGSVILYGGSGNAFTGIHEEVAGFVGGGRREPWPTPTCRSRPASWPRMRRDGSASALGSTRPSGSWRRARI